MDPKEKVIDMMHQGIEFEERDVFISIEKSLELLGSLDVPQGKKLEIREKLEMLRTDTIGHINRFKKAHRELEVGSQ